MDHDLVPAETLREPPYDGNVAQLLERAVTEHADDVAIERDGRTVTYREFDELVDRFARGLREFDLAPEDRVGVYIPNGVPFCAVIWACCRAGVIASPLNPAYRRREIEYQLEHADARAILVDGDAADHVTGAVDALETDVEIISTARDSEHATLFDHETVRDDDERIVARTDDDILLQPYTSGTTGTPKGVLLTHRNFRVQIANSVSSYSASPFQGDAVIVLPMYHITGLLQMLSSLCAGRTLHLLRPDQWDPDLVLETIAENDVSAFVAVAAMFVDLLEAYDPDDEYDFSTLLRAGQGGDTLPTSVQERFEETFDVTVSEGYGLTETTAGTHTIRSSTLGNKPGSVGQPVGHTRSKIVDEDGVEVPAGEEGELLVAGPQVMAGYYDDPEATAEAFTEDGFFRTGDIATRDADNYHYISGREKEMILTAGYNVYPREVETVLYDHPEIHEAAVFGIPDERRGETVAAAVVPAASSDAALTETAVEEFVLGELAPYKHPRVVEIRRELPKTGSGKIQKTILRDEFVDAHVEEPRSADDR